MKRIVFFNLLVIFTIFSAIFSFGDSNTSIYDLQAKFNSIGEKVSPSVVSISTEKTITQRYEPFDPFDFFFKSPWDNNDNNKKNPPKKKEFKQGGLGSGVIYMKKNNSYYIITNNHVIEDVDKIKVIINEKTYIGKLLGTDPDVDIAVVEINTKDSLTVANFGDSDKLKTGDFVLAIGNPFGLQGSMTFGIISALGRSDINAGRVNLTNFIQTDAAINPGNSGGPLLNLSGEVIGINTLIFSRSGGNIGIGFAIPVNIAKATANQIIESGKVEHGYLGVIFEELNEDKIKTLNITGTKYGMHVLNIMENSAASKAGIIVGDILLQLNGKELKKSSDLTIAIGNSKPGSKVTFKILRDNKVIEKEVILGNRNDMKAINTKADSEIFDQYGIQLANLNNELKKQYNLPNNLNGVLIIKIDPQGMAASAGIEEGDVIYKINDKKVNSIEELKTILKDNDDNTNYFFLYRKGKEFIVTM